MDNMLNDPVEDFLAREQENFASLESGDGALFMNNAPAANPSGDMAAIFGSDDLTLKDESSANIFQQDNPAPVTTDVFAAVSSMDRQRQEPESMIRWREEQKARLAAQDEKEAKDIEEMKEKAKNELSEWYKRHEEQVAKNKENNRLTEDEFLGQRDNFNNVEGGWERISNLCDFNPKNSKCSKDVSRMRSIFINLKKNPIAIQH